MLSEFLVYLRLGLQHITDLRGYDHIVFVAALTAGYAPRDWRRLLVLVTAFTVGHSLTLALATLGLVSVDAGAVELLIPVTILLTSAAALAAQRRPVEDVSRGGTQFSYLAAVTFGLIHGLGFSSYLRALLGAEESIALPLLAFNVGLEVGQICIVAVVLAAGALAARVVGRRGWVLLLSAAAAALALVMLVNRSRAL